MRIPNRAGFFRGTIFPVSVIVAILAAMALLGMPRGCGDGVEKRQTAAVQTQERGVEQGVDREYDSRNMSKEDYRSVVLSACREKAVDFPDIIFALIGKESGFPKNSLAVPNGRDGEEGILQIMPEVAKKYENGDGRAYVLKYPLESCRVAIDILQDFWARGRDDCQNWQEAVILWSTKNGPDKVKTYREHGISGLSDEVKSVLARFEEFHKQARAVFPSSSEIVFSESKPSTMVATGLTPDTASRDTVPDTTPQQKVTVEDLHQAKGNLQNITQSLVGFVQKKIGDRERNKEEARKALAPKELVWPSFKPKPQQHPVMSAVDKSIVREQVSAEKQKEIDSLKQQLEHYKVEKDENIAVIRELEDRIEELSFDSQTDTSPTSSNMRSTTKKMKQTIDEGIPEVENIGEIPKSYSDKKMFFGRYTMFRVKRD